MTQPWQAIKGIADGYTALDNLPQRCYVVKRAAAGFSSYRPLNRFALLAPKMEFIQNFGRYIRIYTTVAIYKYLKLIIHAVMTVNRISKELI